MRHDMNELFHIVGNPKIYSAKAVEFVNQSIRASKAQKGDAVRIHSKTNSGKPFRIYDEINSKEYRLGYQFGEKTWFDTEEELKTAREEYQRERKEIHERNALLKELANLSTEELRKLVNKAERA